MVVFNPLKKEIDIKIVYYGPALCGKTTNIKSVHLALNPNQRGELVSLATKDDRTLFFDFLPIELGNIKGFKTRFHIYTVPGQVFYTLTRRAVLTGVDGIIFVADSQDEKMKENEESLDDLKDNLKYYKKDLESIPFVIQYNKRDLDNILPLEDMEKQLNPLQAPSFDASAVNGKGVMETLTICCKMVLKQIQDKSGSKKSVEIKEKERDKEKIEQAINELPELTLVKPCNPEKQLQNEPLEQLTEPAVQPVEVSETDLRAEEQYEKLGKEETEGVPEMMGQEEPIPEAQEEPAAVNDIPMVDSNVQLNESEPLAQEAQGEVQDELLAIDNEIKLEVPSSEVKASEEDVRTVSNPLTEETAKTEAFEGERICPVCSLKFKSNVKQCPICKISLSPDEQEEKGSEIQSDEPMTAAESVLEDDLTSVAETLDESQDNQGLEIIACGQPRKMSSTAIRVPLIMKINKNGQECKVNLAISFEDFILNGKR